MLKYGNARRIVMLLMVLAVAFAWATAGNVRAAAGDRAETSAAIGAGVDQGKATSGAPQKDATPATTAKNAAGKPAAPKADQKGGMSGAAMTPQQMRDRLATPDQRRAAGERLKALKAKVAADKGVAGVSLAKDLVVNATTGAMVPDYFGTTPNFATSPTNLRKFVDTLPDLKGLLATPDTTTYPGSDYFEIELVEYDNWKFHTDLPGPAKMRGYRQTNVAGTLPAPSYLGPVILATRNRPTRIKFTNHLPTTANGGNLFIPTDTTIMGAGAGYDSTTNQAGIYPQNRATLHLHGGLTPWVSDGTPHQWVTPTGEPGPLTTGVSTQPVPDMDLPPGNSMTFYWTNQQSGRMMFYHDHAYGITRLNVYAGEAAGYLLYDAAQDDALANLGVPGTVGSTAATTDLAHLIPLVIQDKTFVWGTAPVPCGNTTTPGTGTFALDPTWCDPIRSWAQTPGSLWYPHVYMPNENPSDAATGINAMGRWLYAMWFWPPYTGVVANPDIPNPYYDPILAPWENPTMPGMPNPTLVPEAFMDTPIVNGKAYPTLTVDPTKYQFRILNASNDRFWNLSFFRAANIISSIVVTNPGSGYTRPPGVRVDGQLLIPFSGGVSSAGPLGTGASAAATIDPVTGAVTSIDIYCVGSGYPVGATTVTIDPPPAGGTQATATAVVYDGKTEVGMVPLNSSQNNLTPFPDWWYTQGDIFTFDDRFGGVPDPNLRGPAMVQITNEGGMLPAPALIRNQPVNYEYSRGSIVITNVKQHALFMGPAERADVIVDFSQFAGQTLILYSDSPAPVPAGDPRLDYYTGDLDQTGSGGAATTLPGYGPNTRTVMQVVVNPLPGGVVATNPPVDYVDPAFLAQLSSTTGLPAIFALTQDPIIVPQIAYKSAYPTQLATLAADVPGVNYSRIAERWMDITPLGAATPIRFVLNNKAIQELFELDYGRLNSTLGIELPFTNANNQTTLPLGYIEPPTEILDASATIAAPTLGDGTQIWKITHNGVDTHAIHFHLFNVQVINRIGWDGVVRMPDANELGWKETVKMSQLEDIIVAMRPTTPLLPFGLPDSYRLMDVTQPAGATFQGINTTTGAQQLFTNAVVNFGWEYVWHCHLLGHEENDMMRPIVYNTVRTRPTAPTNVAYAKTGGIVTLTWGDTTPFNYATGLPLSTLGNPANEIGFRIERALVTGVAVGAYSTSALVGANKATWTATAAEPAGTWSYRVVAYNAAGDGVSLPVLSAPIAGAVPAAPSALVARLVSGPRVQLTWNDNSNNESSFDIERQIGAGAFVPLASVARNTATYSDSTVTAGNVYTYRVRATNAAGSSAYATSGPVSVIVPVAPSNLIAGLVMVGATRDAVTLRWTNNAAAGTVNNLTLQRCLGSTAACSLPDGIWTNVSTAIGANATAYTVTNVVKRTTYSFRIRAVNFAGPSAWSNLVGVIFP